MFQFLTLFPYQSSRRLKQRAVLLSNDFLQVELSLLRPWGKASSYYFENSALGRFWGYCIRQGSYKNTKN